jgi:Mor family transcriptional regulator
MIPAGYTALEDGTIIGRRGKPLKLTLGANGYLTFCAWVDGKTANFGVHRVVCEAFHGPRPFPGAQVRHLDGNPLNCRADNLKWGTVKENAADKKQHGTDQSGTRNPRAKLTWEQVHEIRKRHTTENTSITALAAEYRVGVTTLFHIIDGQTWVDPDYVPRVDPATRRGTKLTARQVREIRLLYAAGGVTYSDLAMDYNVSSRQVGQIIRRKTWKHI